MGAASGREIPEQQLWSAAHSLRPTEHGGPVSSGFLRLHPRPTTLAPKLENSRKPHPDFSPAMTRELEADVANKSSPWGHQGDNAAFPLSLTPHWRDVPKEPIRGTAGQHVSVGCSAVASSSSVAGFVIALASFDSP